MPSAACTTLHPLSAEFYGVDRAGFQAVTAIGAVRLIGAGPHLADLQAVIAIIAGVGLEYPEEGYALQNLQQTTGRAGEAAPQVGEDESGCHQSQNDEGPCKPEGRGVLERELHGTPEFTDADGNHPARVAKAEPQEQGYGQSGQEPQGSEPGETIPETQLEKGNLSYQLVDHAAGTQPAAECPAEENHRDGQQEPETPEEGRDSAPAGYDRADPAVNEGNREGAAEDAVE